MKNIVKGSGISFVLHGAILCSFMSIGTLLPAANKAKVIDFSLVERLGAPQKQLAKSTPPLTAPPILKPASNPQVARIVEKITVPVQEEELIAKHEVDPEPLPNDPFVAPDETITATAPTLTAEIHGLIADATATDVAEKGLIKKLYVKVNFHHIKDNIQNKISYPRLARKMGWEGKVIVSFVVGKDGKIQEVHIVESSGFAALDKNAIATIRKAAPFPCPPASAELVVPVIYRLA
jgi:protein TonB